MTTIHTRQLQQ